MQVVHFFFFQYLFRKVIKAKKYMVMNKKVIFSVNSNHAFPLTIMVNIETVTNPFDNLNKCI